MGYIVSPDAVNEPWIRAIIERHERLKENATLKRRPDVEIGYWTPNEWRDQEHLHQQHHRQQQQQQQEQQLRQQQYQQRQKNVRYRQQQQQQQHQYQLQQQHETSRRWQHQQHYKQETAKTASAVLRVEVRADGETAQAEKGSAPPTSQTTSKPQSLSEYPVVLLASQQMCRMVLSSHDEQLESMENGFLRKPVQDACEEKLDKLVQGSEGPQQSMHAAQPRPCSPVDEAGEEEMGVLGKDLVVAGGLVIAAGGAGVEDQRPPFWDDGKFSVWWLAPEGRDVGDGKVVMGDGSLGMEFGAQDSPPLLQQQQKLLAPPPQEPWPPPIMAAEHEGSGAGTCGEDGLGLEGFSITRLDFSFGCGSDGVLSCGNGFCKESSGKGDDEEDTVDGRVWERVGIGTGARRRAFWGSEVAFRRLTQRRRERVREK